jgi:hypothetical protein
MRRLFPETATEAWNPELDALLGARERARLERSIISGPPFAALPPRPVQVWRKLLLLDSPAHRTRFIVTHLATLATKGRGQKAEGRSQDPRQNVPDFCLLPSAFCLVN